MFYFTESPADLAWYKVDKQELEDEIKQAYAVKCDTEALIRLPFNASGMRCALCRRAINTEKEYNFTVKEMETILEISPEAVGKWIVFYQQ